MSELRINKMRINVVRTREARIRNNNKNVVERVDEGRSDDMRMNKMR